jgi:hypothetical protein
MAVRGYLSERYQSADRPFRRANASNAFIGVAPRYLIEAVAMSLIAALATVLVHQGQDLNRIVPVLGTLAWEQIVCCRPYSNVLEPLRPFGAQRFLCIERLRHSSVQ